MGFCLPDRSISLVIYLLHLKTHAGPQVPSVPIHIYLLCLSKSMLACRPFSPPQLLYCATSQAVAVYRLPSSKRATSLYNNSKPNPLTPTILASPYNSKPTPSSPPILLILHIALAIVYLLLSFSALDSFRCPCSLLPIIKTLPPIMEQPFWWFLHWSLT